MRKFKGKKGIRDTSNGKFEYHGFRHPLGEHSFMAYMHGHRKMADGTLRSSNNWWDVWDKTVSLQSMARHIADLEAIHAGFRVFKERIGDAEYTHILQKGDSPKTDWQEVTEEDCCNAIRFNAEAYKLDILKKNT